MHWSQRVARPCQAGGPSLTTDRYARNVTTAPTTPTHPHTCYIRRWERGGGSGGVHAAKYKRLKLRGGLAWRPFKWLLSKLPLQRKLNYSSAAQSWTDEGYAYIAYCFKEFRTALYLCTHTCGIRRHSFVQELKYSPLFNTNLLFSSWLIALSLICAKCKRYLLRKSFPYLIIYLCDLYCNCQLL